MAVNSVNRVSLVRPASADMAVDAMKRGRSHSQSQMMASIIERNQSFAVEGPSNSDRMKMQMEMESVLLAAIDRKQQKGFALADMLPFLGDGMSLVVEDGFHKCFQTSPVCSWNWTPTLYIVWCLGVLIRYGILFPLRFVALIVAMLLTAIAFLFGYVLFKGERRALFHGKCIMFLACSFVFSWTGLIRFHGKLPERKASQIYAANHTSMIDVIVLLQQAPFSVVGQHHAGWVAFFQDHVLSSLDCIWFQRAEIKDRSITANRIKDHIRNPAGNRLLIFPEGTCVNNEYCVQFKKGIFDMGAEICPIAIKYDKQFVDAFWNSRAQPFHMHLFHLMTRWAVVGDVWFLPPTSIGENETPIQFAARVKASIAHMAGLKNVDWDGYMKYLVPSSRFLQKRQQIFAESVLKKLVSGETDFQPDSNHEAGAMIRERRVTKT